MKELSSEKIEDKLKELRNQKPSSEWVNNARSEIYTFTKTNSSSQKILFFNILSMLKGRKKFLIPALLLFFTIVVASSGLLLYYFFGSQKKDLNLSYEEQQEIFKNILKNNSNNILAKNVGNTNAQNLSATDESASRDSVASSAKMSAPAYGGIVGSEYSYYYNKTETRRGNAISLCKAIDETSSYSPSYESYQYHNSDWTENHEKSITYSAEGELDSYYLSNQTSDSSTSYEYRGGSFAIKTITYYQAATSGSVDDLNVVPNAEDRVEINVDESVNNEITNYFGSDAKITSEVTENGKTYYVIEHSYVQDCNQPFYILLDSRVPVAEQESSPDNKTIVVEEWVEKDTFQLRRSKTYLESISEDNLLTEIVFTTEMSNVSFSEVADKFNFDYGVEIKEQVNDYRNYVENEKQDIVSYLTEENVQLLFIDGLTLDNIYASKIWTDRINSTNYYLDRNFYPSGERGDKMYEEMTQFSRFDSSTEAWYDEALVITNFSKLVGDIYQSVGINIHQSNKSADDLLKNYTYNPDNLEVADVSFMVNGVAVAAKKYTATYSYESMTTDEIYYKEGEASSSVGTMIAPDIAPCTEGTCTSTSSFYYLELNGFQYVIQLYETDEASLIFTSKTMQSDSEFIRSAIEEMYTKRSDVVKPTEPMPLY
jgi:hypothetical protein